MPTMENDLENCHENLNNDDKSMAVEKLKESFLILKQKMCRSHDLIQRYNDKLKECERLKSDLDAAHKETKKLTSNNNTTLSKVIKLEMQNTEYKKNIQTLSKRINEHETKIAADQQHVHQLECKMKDIEIKHAEKIMEYDLEKSSLQVKIKDLEKELKATKRMHEVNIKKMVKKSQFILNSDDESSEGRKPCVDVAVNTVDLPCQKPVTTEKSVMTDEFYNVQDDPYPLFCTKCEDHFKPPLPENICKMMGTCPKLIEEISSPKSLSSNVHSGVRRNSDGYDAHQISRETHESPKNMQKALHESYEVSQEMNEIPPRSHTLYESPGLSQETHETLYGVDDNDRFNVPTVVNPYSQVLKTLQTRIKKLDRKMKEHLRSNKEVRNNSCRYQHQACCTQSTYSTPPPEFWLQLMQMFKAKQEVCKSSKKKLHKFSLKKIKLKRDRLTRNIPNSSYGWHIESMTNKVRHHQNKTVKPKHITTSTNYLFDTTDLSTSESSDASEKNERTHVFDVPENDLECTEQSSTTVPGYKRAENLTNSSTCDGTQDKAFPSNAILLVTPQVRETQSRCENMLKRVRNLKRKQVAGNMCSRGMTIPKESTPDITKSTCDSRALVEHIENNDISISPVPAVTKKRRIAHVPKQSQERHVDSDMEKDTACNGEPSKLGSDVSKNGNCSSNALFETVKVPLKNGQRAPEGNPTSLARHDRNVDNSSLPSLNDQQECRKNCNGSIVSKLFVPPKKQTTNTHRSASTCYINKDAASSSTNKKGVEELTSEIFNNRINKGKRSVDSDDKVLSEVRKGGSSGQVTKLKTDNVINSNAHPVSSKLLEHDENKNISISSEQTTPNRRPAEYARESSEDRQIRLDPEKRLMHNEELMSPQSEISDDRNTNCNAIASDDCIAVEQTVQLSSDSNIQPREDVHQNQHKDVPLNSNVADKEEPVQSTCLNANICQNGDISEITNDIRQTNSVSSQSREVEYASSSTTDSAYSSKTDTARNDDVKNSESTETPCASPTFPEETIDFEDVKPPPCVERRKECEIQVDEIDKQELKSIDIKEEHEYTNGTQNVEATAPTACIPTAILERYVNGQQRLGKKRKTEKQKKHAQRIIVRIDKFVKKQIQRIMDSAWQTPLHNDVVEKLSTICSPRIVAKCIVDYLCEDSYRKARLDNTYTPPAPPMTKTQQRISALLVDLDALRPIINYVFQFIEYKIFHLNQAPHENVIKSLARMYTVLAHIKKDREKARMFCCDALYSLGLQAIPLIYTVLTCWAEVFPNGETNSELLPKCMSHLIMEQQAKDYPKLVSLKHLLSAYYKYPSGKYVTQDFLQELLIALQRKHQSGLNTAVILLAKRKGVSWAHTYIVRGGLMPMIVNDNHPYPYKAFFLLGSVMRAFPLNSKDNFVEQIVEQLCDLINSGEGFHDQQEGIASALLCLSRHRFDAIAPAVLRWVPQKPLRLATVEQLEVLFNSRPAVYWAQHMKKS